MLKFSSWTNQLRAFPLRSAIVSLELLKISLGQMLAWCTSRIKALDLASLTELMTGTRYRGALRRRESSVQPGSQALQLKQFGVRGRVGPIDLEVASGEIVGFAGLVGAGRT